MPKKLELDNMAPDELLTNLLIDVGHGYQLRPHALKRKVADTFSAYNPQTHRLVPINKNDVVPIADRHVVINSGYKLVPIIKNNDDIVPIVDRHIIVNSGWDFGGLRHSKRTSKAFAKAHVDEPWNELTLMQQRQWRAIRDGYIKNYIHATT